MARKTKHPNKEIREAIKYADSKGWRIKETGKSSHAFCRLLCPEKSIDGHTKSVWRTPKVPENHVKEIIKAVDRCNHKDNEDEDA